MRGKTSPGYPRRELVRNSHTTAERVPTRMSPIGACRVHSWKWPRLVELNGIRGSESQLCERGEHLRARQHISRASLRESMLGGSYIQQAPHTVVIRFQSGIVGLAGGLQEREG